MSAPALPSHLPDHFLPREQNKETQRINFLHLPPEVKLRVYQYVIGKGETHITVERITESTNYVDNNPPSKEVFTMQPCIHQRTFDENRRTWESHYSTCLAADWRCDNKPHLSLFFVCKEIFCHAQEVFLSHNRLIFKISKATKKFITSVNKEARSLVRHVCLEMATGFEVIRFNAFDFDTTATESRREGSIEVKEDHLSLEYKDTKGEARGLQKAITSLLAACPGIKTVMLDGGVIDVPEIPARYEFALRACEENGGYCCRPDGHLARRTKSTLSVHY